MVACAAADVACRYGASDTKARIGLRRRIGPVASRPLNALIIGGKISERRRRQAGSTSPESIAIPFRNGWVGHLNSLSTIVFQITCQQTVSAGKRHHYERLTRGIQIYNVP
jgi:hypothetical protein